MTRRLSIPNAPDRGQPVRLVLDGDPVRAFTSESIAVGLYASGHKVLSRSLKYHRPRAFFCLEGHCNGCLMRIGGVPNLRACMEPCADSVEIAAQNAYPAADLDVLEAVDWLFRRGMDHHTLMTGSSLLNKVANKVVRQLSGLGRLPDKPAAEIPAATAVTCDIVVIGAGPAGLAAATEAAAAGLTTLVLDEHDLPGGSLLSDPRYGLDDAAARAARARAAGAELRLGTTAVAYYAEDRRPVLLAAGPQGLLLIEARRHLYATGGYAVNELFANNDRPGVIAGRAAGRLLVRYGVLPGDRVCVVGGDDYARALGEALAQSGSEVISVAPPHARVVAALGRPWVTGVEIAEGDGDGGRPAATRRYDCDIIAVAATPAPASEAPRQHGCAVEFRPAGHPGGGGFAVTVDASGKTSVDGVFACGDVCGYIGPERAAAMGREVGLAAAASLKAASEVHP